MINNNIFLPYICFAILTGLISCSSSQKVINISTQKQSIQETKEQYQIVKDKIKNHEITFAGGDGATIDNAIIIVGAKTDKESVISEQVYFMIILGIRGQDWQVFSQAAIENKGKMYDLIGIKKLKENTNASYYFDISCCVGKN